MTCIFVVALRISLYLFFVCLSNSRFCCNTVNKHKVSKNRFLVKSFWLLEPEFDFYDSERRCNPHHLFVKF